MKQLLKFIANQYFLAVSMSVIILALLVASFTQAPPAGDALRYMPIQDGGRIKPFDIFAREMLSVVYGKQKFEGREAREIILTWMLGPEAWQDKRIFEIRNHEVLKNLGLPLGQRHFTGDEIFSNPQLQPMMMDLENKRKAKEKLTAYFQDLQRLENQFFVFREIATGRLLRLIPNSDPSVTSWKSIPEFEEKFQTSFMEITQAFVEQLGALTKPDVDSSALADVKGRLDKAVLQFVTLAKEVQPEAFPSDMRLKAEIHLIDYHPFQMAYIFYILGSLCMLMGWVFAGKMSFITKANAAAWIFLFVGLVLHTYGFLIRVYIMERAPVSNMYETVVWVSWGALVFAFILEAIYKFRLLLFAGAIGGIFCLVLADYAPAVLDPSLQPLEAVLRSNYWLTVHVMTITISYAAFLLAFVLGDVGLFYFWKGAKEHKKQIDEVVVGIYRSMQIGVAFLAPGIILGGIWADESWGRFWGWDPKETWALIALLGYLAVLHGKIAGIIRSFGMVASGVVTFSLVIMAWYGVNYVLGAGLHSYGFGAGGVEYVSGFVLVHFVLVGVVWFRNQAKA